MDRPDTSASHLDYAARRHVPFLELLDIRPVEAERGRCVYEMTVAERHLRTRGLLHGGVTASLMDTAMGYAAGTTAPEGHYVVTVQLNLNYVRPGWEGERLLAAGEVQHAGRKTAVVRGEIRTETGELVALATGTFMYVPESAA